MADNAAAANSQQEDDLSLPRGILAFFIEITSTLMLLKKVSLQE